MITRRQIIGTGLASIGLPLICRSSPVKSMIGADKTFVEEQTPSFDNPYVKDGLKAMWDGEWNSLGGVHNPSAAKWVDLSGNGFDISSPYLKWTENALDDTAYNLRFDLGDLGCTTGITIEAVVRCPNFRNNSYIFDFYNHIDRGITLFCSNLVSPFGLRGSVRNSGGAQNSDTGTSDENYFITGTLTWDENGCTPYFLGYPRWSIYEPFSPPPVYYFLGASNATWNNFRGYVHCARVYDRALSSEEVAYNYSVDNERFRVL